MREFAWVTAGWLNYAKMVWDWANLDDTDIKRAINWQLELPLALQEMVLAVWLIVKGFNSSAIASGSTKIATNKT